MNNKQIAKQKVIRAALATLLEKKALWEALTGMKNDVDALTAVKTALDAEAKVQAVTSHAATAAQQAKRDELRRMVRSAGRVLARYASQIGSPELAVSARVNSRVLAHGSLVEVLPEARRVEELLLANPGALTGSVKDPDFLPTLSAEIEAFETIMGKPRLVIVGRSVATDQIGKLIAQGQQLLEALDPLVEQFEDEDPGFVVAWKHALRGRAAQPQTEPEAEVVTLAPTPEVNAA